MKVKSRRWRSRNSYLQRKRQNNDHGEKLPELKENASGVEVDSSTHEGNCSTHEEKAAASAQEANIASDEANAANDEANGANGEANGADGEVNVANGEANVANGEANVANEEANVPNVEPNNENHANNEINPPIQAAVPASDDEDSGTENDRNDAAAVTDEENEGEKESYQVEVARTMSDIVHTRDMLFSLTRRVDQLLEFCKILQTKQNNHEPEELRHMQQVLQQRCNEGAGKPSPSE